MDHRVMLYFYSNRNHDPERGQGQAIQSVIRPDETIVYHFDTDISNPSVEMLIKKHQIFVAPSIVINGTTYPGYRDKEELEATLYG